MKGVGVAIVDVDVKEEGEREGIRSYRCDVGDRKMVEDVWKRIDNDVGGLGARIKKQVWDSKALC